MQVEELPDGGIKCTMQAEMPEWMQNLSDEELEVVKELIQEEWDKAVKEHMSRVFGGGMGILTPIEEDKCK